MCPQLMGSVVVPWLQGLFCSCKKLGVRGAALIMIQKAPGYKDLVAARGRIVVAAEVVNGA